jgi:proteasome lid subunit RPN8/RPN11
MLRLKPGHVAEMLAHAREGAPQEVCGILAGKNGQVLRIHRATNVAASPLVRYEMEPRQQMEIMLAIDTAGEDMIGIYHSHPLTPAYPSRTDQALAYYPDSVYVIVSLSDPKNHVLRAYRLLEGKVVEEELTISGNDI